MALNQSFDAFGLLWRQQSRHGTRSVGNRVGRAEVVNGIDIGEMQGQAGTGEYDRMFSWNPSCEFPS